MMVVFTPTPTTPIKRRCEVVVTLFSRAINEILGFPEFPRVSPSFPEFPGVSPGFPEFPRVSPGFPEFPRVSPSKLLFRFGDVRRQENDDD